MILDSFTHTPHLTVIDTNVDDKVGAIKAPSALCAPLKKRSNSLRLSHLPVRIGRVLAQDELLYQGIGDPAPGVDESARENQSRSAIARRMV